MNQPADAPQFVRLKPRSGAAVPFRIDGRACEAQAGDTILTALLLHQGHARPFEFGAGLRAGFCLMGACQDCWVTLADGRRLRSCATLLTPDLDIITRGNQ